MWEHEDCEVQASNMKLKLTKERFELRCSNGVR